MLKFFYLLFASLLGNSVARVLTGAGLSLVSFAALTPLVLGGLDMAAGSFNNMGGEIIALANLAGFGVALSLIGSAIMTRVAITSVMMGVKKATAGA